jgi:hypothetical protein
VQGHGRQTAIDVLKLAESFADFEWKEAQAEHVAEQQQLDEGVAILAGLPEGTSLQEAAWIKAAQGDPVAAKWHAYFNSRECKLNEAIADAAMEKHPGWRVLPDGISEKLDDAAREPDGLIEWFYKTYPQEAREIERRIDGYEVAV